MDNIEHPIGKDESAAIEKQLDGYLSQVEKIEDGKELGRISSFVDGQAGNFPDLAERFKKLDDQVTARRDHLAKALLDRALQTSDPGRKREILNDAAELAVQESLLAEIEDARAAIPTQNRSEILAQLYLLNNKEDLPSFVSALASLEKSKDEGSYPFTEDEVKRIRDARIWYDEKRAKDGVRISLVRLGDLRQRYLAYRSLLTAKETRVMLDKDKVLPYQEQLAEFKSFYDIESRKVCEEYLNKLVGTVAISSPSTARDSLRQLLDETVEVEVGDEAHSQKEVIKKLPFADKEIATIEDNIKLLEEPCRQEALAKSLRDKSQQVVNPYAKYDLLLQAKNVNWTIQWGGSNIISTLPGLDEQIYEVYDPAVRYYCDDVGENIALFKRELEQVYELGRDALRSQLKKLDEKLESLRSQVAQWPAQKQMLRLHIDGRSQERVLEYPDRLTQLDGDVKSLVSELSTLKADYERLLEEDQKIRRQLVSSDPEERQLGLQAFDRLRRNEQIQRLQIFAELQDFVVQQTDFDMAAKAIEEQYVNNNWTAVVRMCREFVLKENYDTKCPPKTKQHIAELHQTADRELKLQVLKRLTADEDYRGAKRILDVLTQARADLTSVMDEVRKVELAEREGNAVWDFYNKAMHQIGLDGHLLVRVIQNPEEVRESLEQKGVKGKEVQLVRDLFSAAGGLFSEEDYEEHLGLQLKNISFDHKIETLKKMEYIAGFTSQGIPEWPAYSISFAKGYARKLSRYLRNLIKKEAFEAIQAAEKRPDEKTLVAVSNRVGAIHELRIPLSDEEQSVLENVEVASAKARAGRLDADQYEQLVEIWGSVKEHFPNHPTVLVMYRKAKTLQYVRQIQNLRARGERESALELNDRGLNDEDVGAVWQLYLEKARTCLDLEQYDHARKALGEVGRAYANTNQVKELLAQIEVSQRINRLKEAPILLIRSLIDYWHETTGIQKRVVRQEIGEEYNDISGQLIARIEAQLALDKDQALQNILDLRVIEKLYQALEPRLVRSSQVFVEQFLPDLYPTGKNLHDSVAVFKQSLQVPNVSLYKSLTDGEQLSIRLRSFVELLISTHVGEIDANASLAQVIREIIEGIRLDVNKKAAYLRQLEQFTQAERRPVLYVHVADDRDALKAVMESLATVKGKLESATDLKTWLSAASMALDGEAQSWKELDAEKKVLSRVHSFSEVVDFINALGIWQDSMQEIHRLYMQLRSQFGSEKFAEAGTTATSLEEQLDALPQFSAQMDKTEFLEQLRGKFKVRNTFETLDIFGLKDIEKAIRDLLDEISNWESYAQKKGKESVELAERLTGFKDKVVDGYIDEGGRDVSSFRADYEKFEAFAWQSREKDDLLRYFSVVEELKYAQAEATTDLRSLLMPSRMPDLIGKENAKDEVHAVPAAKKTNPFKTLLNIGKGSQPTASKPLLNGILSSQNVKFPLLRQSKAIESLLEAAESAIREDGRPLQVRTMKSNEFKKTCEALRVETQTLIDRLKDVQKRNRDCREVRPYPYRVKLMELKEGKRNNNLAFAIIEADLIGTDVPREKDAVEAFRDYLVKLWS